MVRRTFLGGSGVRSVFMISMATMAVDVDDNNNVVAIKIRGQDRSETGQTGSFRGVVVRDNNRAGVGE